MNTLQWSDDPSVDEIPQPLHSLYECVCDERYAVQETVFTKEIYHTINGHGRAYSTDDCSYEYIGQDLDGRDMTIIHLAYIEDARQMLELLREHYGDVEQ